MQLVLPKVAAICHLMCNFDLMLVSNFLMEILCSELEVDSYATVEIKRMNLKYYIALKLNLKHLLKELF